MGADAKAVVQYKDHDYWYTFATIDVERDYNFFGRVAGIRGSELCKEYPRGWPDGYDHTSDIKNYDVAPTWVTRTEFMDILQDIDNTHDEEIHWQWNIVSEMMYLLEIEGYDTRFVIGFDQG